MSKKKKIIYILIGLIILIAIIFILCSHFILNKEPEEFSGFEFKEVNKLNYGSINLSDFVKDITCDEECTYQGKSLEYSISNIEDLGKSEVLVSITYQGKTYEHTYEIEIVDELAPTITLSESEIDILKNSEFDAESFIAEVNDNYDEVSIEAVDIESNVDAKKVGDYLVNYTLTDKAQNTGTASLVVHVVDEENNDDDKKETNSSNNTTNNKNNNTTSNNTNNSNNTSSNFKSAINSVSLSPLTTRYSELDSQIASIISSVTKSSMSNYEKLQAIYNYVKNKLSYEMMVLDLNELWKMQDKYSYYDYDGMDVMRAKYSLSTGKGVCDNYAALFMILARRIGFDAYVAGGSVNKVGGGTTGHAWVMIKAGGTYYIFDPQIEDSKKTSYDYFGKTDSELPIYHYNLSSNISKFHYFKENPDLAHMYTLYVNITGDYNNEATLTNGARRTSMTKLDLGSSMTVELHTDITQKYIVEISVNDTIISTEEWDGTTKIINHTFDTVGQEKFTVAVYADRYRLEYVFDMTIKEPELTNTEVAEN